MPLNYATKWFVCAGARERLNTLESACRIGELTPFPKLRQQQQQQPV